MHRNGTPSDDGMPRFRQRSSIVFKLAVAFIVGSCFPLALAIGVSYEESVRTTTHEVKNHLHELAIGRDSTLTEHIEGLKHTVEGIAHARDIIEFVETGGDDSNAAAQLIHAVQEAHWGETHHLFLTDTNGAVVLSPDHQPWDQEVGSVPQSTHLGESIASSDWFSRALTGVQVTDFFGFEERDHYHQLILHPIQGHDGEVRGTVVLEVSIDYIESMLKRDFTLGDSGRLYLATQSGKMVVHRKEDENLSRPAEGLIEAINSGEPAIGEFESADQQQVFGVYRPSSVYPWILCVEIDSAEVRKPLADHRANLLMLSGVILATLFGFAILFCKLFGAPLRKTAEMVERLAEGDLETPIEVTSTDEIGLVQTSIESVRLRLREQIRTLDEQIEEGLRELRFQKMAMDEHAIVSVADASGRIIYVNQKFCDISGYTEDELIGQSHRIVNSGHHPESFFASLHRTIAGGEIWQGEICNRAKDGAQFWVESSIVPAMDEHGDIIRYTSVRTDITARKVAQERFTTAVRGSRDGLWDWNLVTDEVYYAPRFNEMLGLEEGTLQNRPEEWIGLILSEDLGLFQSKLEQHVNGSDEIFECEIRMIHADGEPRWMLCRGAAIRNAKGMATRLAGSLAEITQMKKAQRDLKRAAEHDRLTDLPNRSLFDKHAQRAIEIQTGGAGGTFAILFFDFDRFKVINDSLGHKVGDELLISIAERFNNELRPYDVAARFGGDEFVVLLNNLKSTQEGEEIADRLLREFAKPHAIGGHSVKSTASIGFVSSDMGYESSDEMIRDADAAMYQAKTAGRGRVVVFDTDMHSEALDRLTLEEDLERAIHLQQLRLYYQPIINLETGGLEGFEALIRWQHPERGLVPPDKFIGIAEDNGSIIEIGEWVLRAACVQIKHWNESFPVESPMFMNVNVSKRQITHPGCVESIKKTLDETGIDPTLIKIEITESTIVDNRSDIIPTLEQIRELGCRLAMDDFGTGHSSLSGLHRFPIDILKIDRSFIASMEESRELAAVVHSIVTLAQHLGMDIVAEGIEKPAQITILQSHGVEYGQGYHFARPMPPIDAEAFILTINEGQAVAA